MFFFLSKNRKFKDSNASSIHTSAGKTLVAEYGLQSDLILKRKLSLLLLLNQ